jgi:hypothetical protein
MTASLIVPPMVSSDASSSSGSCGVRALSSRYWPFLLYWIRPLATEIRKTSPAA